MITKKLKVGQMLWRLIVNNGYFTINLVEVKSKGKDYYVLMSHKHGDIDESGVFWKEDKQNFSNQFCLNALTLVNPEPNRFDGHYFLTFEDLKCALIECQQKAIQRELSIIKQIALLKEPEND